MTIPIQPQPEFEEGDAFLRDIKKLKKKYRNVGTDIEAVKRLISAGQKASLQPTKPQGFGNQDVWKARAMSRDLNKGKSGGFRIWWVEHGNHFLFVYIYTHSQDVKEHEVVAEVSKRLSDLGY